MGFVALLALGDDVYARDAGTASPEPSTRKVTDTSIEQTIKSDNPALLGAPVEVAITVRHPGDTQVFPPESWEAGRWELIDSSATQTSDEAGVTSRFDLLYSVYRPGETTLPPLDLKVQDRAGETTTIQTEPVTVKFIAQLNDQDSPTLQPPRQSVSVWVEDHTLAWVGAVAGAGLLGALFAFFFFGRREVLEIAPPPRPAHEVALEKLGRLAGDDHVESGDYMPYYVRLSETVREYLGRIHDFPGTELTTSEIRARLEDFTWPRGLSHEDVMGLLAHCDAVKFAGMIPSSERANEALRRAFSIVELTRARSIARTGSTEVTDSADTPESDAPVEAESQWAPAADHEDAIDEQIPDEEA